MKKKYLIYCLFISLISCNNEKKEYYPNGAIRHSFNLNTNHELEGESKEYYENGNIKSIEYYKNGLRIDSSLYYDKNAKLSLAIYYKKKRHYTL